MRVLDLKTNTEIDLPEQEVAARYLAGTIRTPEGARIPMVDRAGNVGSVDPSLLPSAIEAGYSLASEGALREAELEAKYGGIGSAALAGAEGVGRGLTFGLSEGALNLALGDEYSEGAKARAELNPVASIGGEVVGALAPALLSGGTSAGASGAGLAARGARAATALPRLAARGGLMAEAATARALGEGASVGGRILRAAAAKGVGGAVEALPYAVGRGISTAVIDDDASAEKILAQIGLETIAGGLAGGILGGAGRATSEGYEAAARRLFGDATHPGVGEALVKASAAMSGDNPAVLRRLALGDAGEGLLSEGARKNRALAFFGVDETRERVARELTTGLDDVKRALDTASNAFKGDVKTARIASMLPEANAADQLMAHRRELEVVREQLDGLLADRTIPWRKELRELRASAARELPDDAARAFAQVDGLKRAMQSKVSALGKISQRSDQTAVVERGREVLGVLEGSQERLRGHLMDDGLFGAAAAAQREINDPWAKLIAANRNLESRARLFRTVESATPGRYTDSVADHEAVNRYLGTLTNPNKDATHTAMREWLDNGDAFVAAVRKHGGTPEVIKAADDYQRAAAGIRKGLAEAEDAIVLGNQARALTTSTSLDGGGGSMIGTGASLALDSLAPLGATAVIGAGKSAVGLLSAPGRTLQRMASLERLAARATERLDAGLGTYLRSVGTRVKGAAKTATLATARSTYARTRDRLEAAKEQPEAARAAVVRSMEPAGSPEATAKMVARVEKSNAFLASKLPAGKSASTWRKSEPSDSEIQRFARYVAAAEDPVGTLTKELDSRTLSRETMETLRELYPALSGEIVARVSDHVADMKEPPPYDEMIRLSLLLGTPLDPSMDPAKIAVIQSSYQYSDQGAQRPRPASRMADVAKAYGSSMDQLEA